MNTDELNDLWNSPANDLTEEQRAGFSELLARRMIRRRRFRAVHLTTTGLILAACLVGAVWSLMNGKLELSREWAVLPLLCLPCAFYVHYLRRFFTGDSVGGTYSISESLRRSLAAIRRELVHLRCVGLLIALNVPVLVLAVGQLRSVGKMTDREIGFMAFGFTLALGIGLGFAAFRYFARLLPEEKRIRELLGDAPEAGL